MKQFLLAAVLIAVPVAAFSAFELYFAKPAVAVVSLGDLSGLRAIVTDVQGIVKGGDLKVAETRITDFETAWDDAEATMRPLNGAAWGKIDDAADAALHALRAAAPDSAKVTETLAMLVDTLDHPYDGVASAEGVRQVSGVAVTDASGHPIACEDMLNELRSAIDGGKVAQDKVADAKDLQAKATERCNADDDLHADEFSAQGLALTTP